MGASQNLGMTVWWMVVINKYYHAYMLHWDGEGDKSYTLKKIMLLYNSKHFSLLLLAFNFFFGNIIVSTVEKKNVSTDKCDLTGGRHYCSLQTSVFIRSIYLCCTFMSGNFNMGHYLLMVLIADLQLKATIWTH